MEMDCFFNGNYYGKFLKLRSVEFSLKIYQKIVKKIRDSKIVFFRNSIIFLKKLFLQIFFFVKKNKNLFLDSLP